MLNEERKARINRLSQEDIADILDNWPWQKIAEEFGCKTKIETEKLKVALNFRAETLLLLAEHDTLKREIEETKEKIKALAVKQAETDVAPWPTDWIDVPRNS